MEREREKENLRKLSRKTRTQPHIDANSTSHAKQEARRHGSAPLEKLGDMAQPH